MPTPHSLPSRTPRGDGARHAASCGLGSPSCTVRHMDWITGECMILPSWEGEAGGGREKDGGRDREGGRGG